MAKVLIVDDNTQIRALMRDCVSELGFGDIEEAGNGRIALEICRKQLPDIITLDWNMPEMDGLEYLIALRKLPNGNQPKVIFCSTESSPAKIQKVLASGADEYITKPFDINKIHETFELLKLI